MKKLISIFFLLALMVLLSPAVSAAEIVDSGSCGENVTWTLDSEGILTISGTGPMEDDTFDSSLFRGSTQITQVVVQEGVTEIGSYAFYSCPNLTRVTLPQGLTRIGEWAFFKCTQLSQADLPEGLESIESRAFCECALARVTIPGSVKAVEEMAFWGNPIKDLTLCQGITSIGWSAFASCYQLQEVHIPDSVTSIGTGAFGDDISLLSVTLPEGLTTLEESMFYGCDSLKEVVLPQSLTTIGRQAFRETPLTHIVIPDSVTRVEAGAFMSCEQLAVVTFGKGLQWIGANAFAYSGITKAVLPEGMEYMDDQVFYGCSSLEEVVLPQTLTRIGNRTFYSCTSLEQINLPDSLTYLGEQAFSGCTRLNHVVLPKGLTRIEALAFEYCKRMDTLVLPEGLTSIGREAFRDCFALRELTLPDSVTDVESGAFFNCTNLIRVEMPDGLTSFGESVFARCERLEDFSFPKGYTKIPRGTFQHCALTEVVIPESVTEIGDIAFWDCDLLTKVWIPGSVTSIGENAFGTCDGETSLYFAGDAPSFHQEAFHKATALTVYYPAGNATWTEAVRQSYDGTVTWVAMENICTHGNAALTNIKAASCEEPGHSGDLSCTSCGYVLEAGKAIPALGHAWDQGVVTKEPTYLEYGEKTFTCGTCGEIKTEALPMIYHEHDYSSVVTSPTCTEQAYFTYTCTICGHTYQWFLNNPLGHSYESGACIRCGGKDPNWQEPETGILRLAGDHRFETAFEAANQMKTVLDIQKFDTVVVASGMDFADALSGSYLAAKNQAPILLACQVAWINDLVKDYIRENLNPGGTVYILGGTSAIPESFQVGLEDFSIRRLAGANRFLTNLMVLQEAGVKDEAILVCTGLGFADSLSASATKSPILLVYGETLLPEQQSFLEARGSGLLYVIGGTGAVSEGIYQELEKYGGAVRLAGKDRFETSAMIAKHLCGGISDTAVLAYAWDFPDGLCGGPLATVLDAPLILTMPNYEQQAADYIQTNKVKKGIVLGGEGLISDSCVDTIFSLP